MDLIDARHTTTVPDPLTLESPQSGSVDQRSRSSSGQNLPVETAGSGPSSGSNARAQKFEVSPDGKRSPKLLLTRHVASQRPFGKDESKQRSRRMLSAVRAQDRNLRAMVTVTRALDPTRASFRGKRRDQPSWARALAEDRVLHGWASRHCLAPAVCGPRGEQRVCTVLGSDRGQQASLQWEEPSVSFADDLAGVPELVAGGPRR